MSPQYQTLAMLFGVFKGISTYCKVRRCEDEPTYRQSALEATGNYNKYIKHVSGESRQAVKTIQMIVAGFEPASREGHPR